MMGLIATPAFAFGGFHHPPPRPNLAHVFLWEKDPSTWQIVPNGAFGKLTYNQSCSKFFYDFDGKKLQPKTPYSLIYYADKPDRFVNWGGDNPGALIASGKSDKKGKLCLKGCKELNMDLPCPPDANYPTGAKLWLVLSSDYDAALAKLTAWNPTEYLFEKDDNNLVTYDDCDVEDLVLDNKDGSWNPVADGTLGGLVFDPNGPTFRFSFLAHGLSASTSYSLIYYADGWPGNHPGALIASGMSDGAGILKIPWSSVELGIDLPDPADANYLTGAKIWLVPSSDYNAGTKAMTAWNTANYLFEMNFITYDDTDV